MGWTWHHASERTSTGKVSPSREVKKLVHGDGFLFDYQEVLAEAFAKNVYYAAIRDNRNNEVWCLVCLTGTTTADYYDFGYKTMEDSMGPCYYDCPDRILDLLTPTENEWANEWREKCRENNRSKRSPQAFKNLPEGAEATWEIPFSFGPFKKGDVLKLRKGRQNPWKQRSRFVWNVVGWGYYLTAGQVHGYEVIA